MTNFEKVVDEEIAKFIASRDLSILGGVLDLFKHCVNLVEYLSKIRTRETCINAVMQSVEKNSGAYWNDWVKPAFSDFQVIAKIPNV